MPQHQQEKETSQVVQDPARSTPTFIPPTLPELLGAMTTELLTALQGDTPGPKQATIQKCLRSMRIWYEGQPVEGRKELARTARKQLEQFKMVGEQFFQEMMTISAQDVQ